jgi:hypothetical protein
LQVIQNEHTFALGPVWHSWNLFRSQLVASWQEKQLVKEAAGHRPCLAQLKLVYKLLTINIS